MTVDSACQPPRNMIFARLSPSSRRSSAAPTRNECPVNLPFNLTESLTHFVFWRCQMIFIANENEFCFSWKEVNHMGNDWLTINGYKRFRYCISGPSKSFSEPRHRYNYLHSIFFIQLIFGDAFQHPNLVVHLHLLLKGSLYRHPWEPG